MIVMGRIRAPFGIKGWVRIQPYTQETGGLLQYRQWWVQDANGWHPRNIAEAAVHADELVVRLEGCSDRGSAAQFKGRDIAIPRSQMPVAPAGEYYWTDLIGLEVTNLHGERLGLVEGLLETGAGAVLSVQDGTQRLLPFADPVVRKVDQDAGQILVDWEKDY